MPVRAGAGSTAAAEGHSSWRGRRKGMVGLSTGVSLGRGFRSVLMPRAPPSMEGLPSAPELPPPRMLGVGRRAPSSPEPAPAPSLGSLPGPNGLLVRAGAAGRDRTELRSRGDGALRGGPAGAGAGPAGAGPVAVGASARTAPGCGEGTGPGRPTPIGAGAGVAGGVRWRPGGAVGAPCIADAGGGAQAGLVGDASGGPVTTRGAAAGSKPLVSALRITSARVA